MPTQKRMRPGLYALLAVVSLAMGALAGALATEDSQANHYHVYCNENGMVHGGSTADSIYHGRVMGTPCQRGKYCGAGQFHNNAAAIGYGGPGVTCDVMLRQYGPECAGWGGGNIDGLMVWHEHQAHSPCFPPFPGGTQA